MSSAALAFAEKIAASFGEKPRHHGRELRVRCPVHEAVGAHNPSMAIWERPGDNVAFKCMAGCYQDQVRAALIARGVAVSRGGPTSPEAQLAAKKFQEERRVEQLEKAKFVLENSRTIVRLDRADMYLSSRGLSYPILRGTLPTLLCGPDPTGTTSLADSAMIGVICDMTTLRRARPKATGISALSLLADGTPRLDSKTGKKFRSVVGSMVGHAVPLGVPGPSLVVGEGVETTLAAMKLLNVGFGAAVLSASNMACLVVPDFVRRVLIAADYDEAGIAAAEGLKKALWPVLPAVSVHCWATQKGWDAADELMRRGDKL